MTCDPNVSAEWVKKNRPGKLYAKISVVVTSVTTTGSATTVAFSAKSWNPMAGAPGPAILTTVSWDETNEDIWIQCPSTLPDPPASGNTGILYLEQALLVPDANGNVISGTPKWPNALPATPTKSLAVWPTSVIVEGYAILNGEVYTETGSVDLLDPTEALTVENSNPGTPPQQLALDGRAVTLSLTPNGYSDGFGLAFPTLTRAVETIKKGAGARAMANAWRTIARWGDVLKAKPDMLPAEAQLLLLQVLKQPTS